MTMTMMYSGEGQRERSKEPSGVDWRRPWQQLGGAVDILQTDPPASCTLCAQRLFEPERLALIDYVEIRIIPGVAVPLASDSPGGAGHFSSFLTFQGTRSLIFFVASVRVVVWPPVARICFCPIFHPVPCRIHDPMLSKDVPRQALQLCMNSTHIAHRPLNPAHGPCGGHGKRGSRTFMSRWIVYSCPLWRPWKRLKKYR